MDDPTSTSTIDPDDDLASTATRTSSDTSASLAELFYDLFPDSTPRGWRDLAYFASLVDDFGALLDIDEQMKRFVAWTLDHGTGVATSPRSGLRAWLKRANTYRLNRPY